MKRQKYKKPRSFLFRIFIFLMKIPLFIFKAALNIKPEEQEPDIIEDLYAQDPSLFDSKPPPQRYPR